MTDDKQVMAFKGFDQNMQCRGFQYEVGKTYDHVGKVEACRGGFHACEYPLDIFGYYPPATSRFARVSLTGELAREQGGDSKVAAARIKVEAEIGLPDIIQAAVKWVFDRAKWSDGPVVTGSNEGATASGARGAATASGDNGAATASGDNGAATASGDSGAATASGARGAATASGDNGAATASGYGGAATASGARGAATASGYGGAATASGARGAATASGDSGAATASGYGGRARGAAGCALFLVQRDINWKILHVWAGIAGRDGIKTNTWYTLKAGKPVECE